MFKEDFKKTVIPNIILGVFGWFGCIFINFIMLGDILMSIHLEIIPGLLGLISIIFFHFVYNKTRRLVHKKENRCLFCSCTFDCIECKKRRVDNDGSKRKD
jgi:hypothetical protein